MSSPKPIGGYFELELPNGGVPPHENSISLSSGRSCFEYVLRSRHIKRVYMPRFTCDVMFEPLDKLKIAYSLYSINDQLELQTPIVLDPDDMLLYTNYFGIKDEYAIELSRIYMDQMILDCSQAFYFAPLLSGHTFYSPRKFFGVPDGGQLVTKGRLSEGLSMDTSFQRATHLLKRIDLGAEEAYEDFLTEDSSLSGQPMRLMSHLTKRLLASIDYETARHTRKRNFDLLHAQLGSRNRIQASLGGASSPMVYPFLTNDKKLRQRLIAQKIFVATYWPNVMTQSSKEDLEFHLAEGIIPLPVDQRYSADDMARIVEVIDAG